MNKITEHIAGGSGYTGPDEDGFARAWTTYWRDELKRDGWTSEPIYGPSNASTKHHKSGFNIHIYEQPCARGWQIVISAWGPDGLAIKLPTEYDWQAIQQSINRCGFCGAENVKTRRVAFANRVCDNCYPKAKRQLEYNGWSN